MRRLNQVGETIVEVMMSAAVLGAVISASYGIVRRSLNDGQAASERTQALKIVESQIEKLKYLATQQVNDVFDQTGPFCIGTTNGVIAIQENTPASDNSLCDHGTFPESNLEIQINYDADGPDDIDGTFDDDTFRVSANWDPISGTESREEVTISYRLHPPVPVTLDQPTAPSCGYSGDVNIGSLANVGGRAVRATNIFGGTQVNNDPWLSRGNAAEPRSNPDFNISDLNIVYNPTPCRYTIQWNMVCSTPTPASVAIANGPGGSVADLRSSCRGSNFTPSPNIGYDQAGESVRMSLYTGVSQSGGDLTTVRCTGDLIGYFDTRDRFRVDGAIESDGYSRSWGGESSLVPNLALDQSASHPISCLNLQSLCYVDYTNSECSEFGGNILNVYGQNGLGLDRNPFWWCRVYDGQPGIRYSNQQRCGVSRGSSVHVEDFRWLHTGRQ